jgi:arylsulfatase A-like enzyme
MALKLGLVDRCLPQLLREQGYNTVYFQSANPFFEDRRRVIRQMSFEQMFAPDVFDLKRFQKANFVGYEDEVMLPSSQRWLEDHKSRRFFATYLTSAPHHECWPLRRHGTLQLAASPALDAYLNNVRSEDFFLQGLVAQYRELGLLDSTVFVILGDHGEAFGEHGRSAHDVVPYEETLRIPMLIWDPGKRLVTPGALKGPVSQLDVMPTLLHLLGFEVVRGRLPGKNMFTRPPLDPIYGSCSANRECATRVMGWQKVIHWYGKRPDEYFDLRADPGEQHDLAATRQAAIAEAVEDLHRWDARVAAIYWGEGLIAQKHP